MSLIGREQIRELLVTLGANKLRTVLTGFAVGWGILLLVVLLSSGTGINNGIRQAIADMGWLSNTVDLQTGFVSIPSNGLAKWSEIPLTEADLKFLQQTNPRDIIAYTPTRQAWGVAVEAQGTSEQRSVYAVGKGYSRMQVFTHVVPGSRFINDQDERDARKVVVIPKGLALNLFHDEKKALGATILLDKIAFKVVGVIKDTQGDFTDMYIPLRTMKVLGLRFEQMSRERVTGATLICPNIRTEAECDSLKARLIRQLAPRLGTSPHDDRILWLNSAAAGNATISGVITGINIFLWIIGLSTLVIGLVGVINIMQISITERKREIGVRKALGAKPQDIISMILAESILITLISGLIGLVVGVGIMATVDYIATTIQAASSSSNGMGMPNIFIHPVITLETAVGALLVMILGGAFAGYLPARKATKIPVVEAMRN